MTTQAMRLTATLKTFIVTDEQDFVPEGTWVEVLGWELKDGFPTGRVDVKAMSYVCMGDHQKDGPCTGENLILSVRPEDLHSQGWMKR